MAPRQDSPTAGRERQQPLSGKVLTPGSVATTLRKVAEVARSEEVHRAARDLVPPVQRLAGAVSRAWRK